MSATDELRALLDERGVAHEAAGLMDEAADAIATLAGGDVDRLRRDLAGYHGTLEALDGLRRRCDRQREQLAALNAAHAPVKGERDAYRRQCGRLAEEAARLRELVRDMWRTLDGTQGGKSSVSCDWLPCTEVCPHWRDGECPSLALDECWYERRMRELGIEADA